MEVANVEGGDEKKQDQGADGERNFHLCLLSVLCSNIYQSSEKLQNILTKL